MGFVRRHLGAWTLVWLSCQIASISALTVFDLRPLAHQDQDCLQAGPAEQCPMRGANGEPCPMHRGSHSDSHQGPATCTLRGTSDASGSELASLFSLVGVLPVVSATTIEPEAAVRVVSVMVPAPIALALDTPPPRA